MVQRRPASQRQDLTARRDQQKKLKKLKDTN